MCVNRLFKIHLLIHTTQRLKLLCPRGLTQSFTDVCHCVASGGRSTWVKVAILQCKNTVLQVLKWKYKNIRIRIYLYTTEVPKVKVLIMQNGPLQSNL